MNPFILNKHLTRLYLSNKILIQNATLTHISLFQTTKILLSNPKCQTVYLFNMNKNTFNIWSSRHLQVRKSEENNKILTPPTIDYRNDSNDDKISTHVRPSEKGTFF